MIKRDFLNHLLPIVVINRPAREANHGGETGETGTGPVIDVTHQTGPVALFGGGILEQHRNGTLLNTVEVVLRWAATFTWRGHAPIVRQIEKVYERGVKLTKSAFRPIAVRLHRADDISKWSLSILPV
ncbi:MAG: hypothetical protein GTO53_13795 [Planctomycetales bacterium]|nr:hypothetical protein [Planctomycetales bacterium]NIM10161.1 hypothetical protein [Planctomycetales bacterium]NIN09587.1 hypothetical protein [Planctomycetales bacterium]NIN78710.1 hypothetical protein [Planctomycetales bacterium]NIO35887.1 hypothetical protein [Planctomycetales bacterium]